MSSPCHRGSVSMRTPQEDGVKPFVIAAFPVM
jgi:hypothetical protein